MTVPSIEPSRITFTQAVNNMTATEFALLLYDLGLVNREHGDRFGWLELLKRRLEIHSPTADWDMLKPQGVLKLCQIHPVGNLLINGGAMAQNDGTGDAVRDMLDTYLTNAFSTSRHEFLTRQTLQNIAERDGIKLRASETGRHIGHVYPTGSNSSIRNSANNYELTPSTGVFVNHGAGLSSGLRLITHNFGGAYTAQLQPNDTAANFAAMIEDHPDGYRSRSLEFLRLPVHRQTIIIDKGAGPAGTFTLDFNNGSTTQTTGAISLTDPFVAAQAAYGGTATTQILNNLRYELSILSNMVQTGPTGGKVPGVAVFARPISATVCHYHVYFFDENKRGAVYSAYTTAGFYSPETSDEVILSATRNAAAIAAGVTITISKQHTTFIDADANGFTGGFYCQLLDRQMRPHLIPTSYSGTAVNQRNCLVPDLYNWKSWLLLYLPGFFADLVANDAEFDYWIADEEAGTLGITDAQYFYPYFGGYSDLGATAAMEWARYATTQPTYGEFYRDVLTETAQSEMPSGTGITGWELFQGTVAYANYKHKAIDTGSQKAQVADCLNAIYELGKTYWPNLKMLNWESRIASSEASPFGIPPPIVFGTRAGSHNNIEFYDGTVTPITSTVGGAVLDYGTTNEADHFLTQSPNLAQDCTFAPQHKVVLKSLARDGSGVVTATAWSDSEVVTEPKRGNDQQFAGWAAGDYLTLVDVTGSASGFTQTTTDPGPYVVLSVAGDGGSLTFQQASARGVSSVTPLNPGFDGNIVCSARRADNWQWFLTYMISIRAMFGASHYPLSGWWSTWFYTTPTMYHVANKDFHAALKYHERLHNPGEDFTPCYFTPGAYEWIGYSVSASGIDNGYRVDATKATEFEDAFAGALRNLDTLCPYKLISPMSCNYDRLSRQDSQYVLSGASLPNRTALFRLDWKPGTNTGIIETTPAYIRVRLADGSVAEFAGMRTSTGATTNGTFLIYTPNG